MLVYVPAEYLIAYWLISLQQPREIRYSIPGNNTSYNVMPLLILGRVF